MALAAVSNSRRWGIVGLLFTASLINYLDRAAISFALPLISKDFHLTPETKGLLLSSFFWSYAFMQVPIGWCADRLNLRWLYAGAFALWSLAQGLTGLAGKPRSLDRVPYSSWGWRIHLLAGRGQDHQRPVQREGSRFAFGTFRLRNSNWTDPRRPAGPVAADPLRLAPHVPHFRFYGHDLDGSLAVGVSSPRPSRKTDCGCLAKRESYPFVGMPCSTAICWASASDFSALTITGTCWSRGCLIIS